MMFLTQPPVCESYTKAAIGRAQGAAGRVGNKHEEYNGAMHFYAIVKFLQRGSQGFIFGYRHLLRQNSIEHALIALSERMICYPEMIR